MLFRGRRIHGRRKKSTALPYRPSILHLPEIPTSTLPKLAGLERDTTVIPQLRLWWIKARALQWEDQVLLFQFNFSPQERTAKAYTTRLRSGGLSSSVLSVSSVPSHSYTSLLHHFQQAKTTAFQSWATSDTGSHSEKHCIKLDFHNNRCWREARTWKHSFFS